MNLEISKINLVLEQLKNQDPKLKIKTFASPKSFIDYLIKTKVRSNWLAWRDQAILIFIQIQLSTLIGYTIYESTIKEFPTVNKDVLFLLILLIVYWPLISFPEKILKQPLELLLKPIGFKFTAVSDLIPSKRVERAIEELKCNNKLTHRYFLKRNYQNFSRQGFYIIVRDELIAHSNYQYIDEIKLEYLIDQICLLSLTDRLKDYQFYLSDSTTLNVILPPVMKEPRFHLTNGTPVTEYSDGFKIHIKE
ncbi:hypothetical protein C7H19_23745 [Aphanothece hegewaldii CCALA 016]|uniref:Uncharacterized protein n=1 Tax=Aphanothece hegewaldii CCALA 016 TaxID=2107694 RepID=A0A2T1LR64_9CHRO|nr:hypothetical protein [Aphanothece hegewaldii]PSF30528.1 hypothetical protein C7H19_23745 [Aphanothece hegewaldii CCALA 016]